MKSTYNNFLLRMILLLFITVNLPFARAEQQGPGPGGNDVNFDTSYAIEYSYSCLEGGCHETSQRLVDEYSQSFMTHTMVKCNACHGTHTAETVGKEKPNLTGYHPGIGATGYTVGRDRCLVCHNNQHQSGKKANGECKTCHTPHTFN